MKIYVSHSREFDFKNELYAPIRNSVLNSKHEFFLPHENDRVINTIETIRSSDLILAEVSFPSTGQGIELGWANMLKVPILCAYKDKEGSHISGSLKYLTQDFVIYQNTEDFIAKISNILEAKP